MLDAMRNLGILKMIDVIDELEPSALESAEAFTEQRKKAIISGTYAKLQFEPIDNETIGIFSLDSDGNVQFIEENVSDDSWKYLFLKTSPRGIYATPTWKREERNKKIIGDAKLKRTVEKYIEDSKHNDAEWVQKIAKIFLSDRIEIGELKESGEIEKKTFYDTITWAMKTKNIKVFSIKIEGKYNADIDELLEIALQNKPKEIYQTKEARSLSPCEIKCSLCNMNGDLYPDVLYGVGINISNVDKSVFFPGVDKENSCKAFPICASCAEALYAAKFHVFNSDSELRQDISGHKSLIIPHLVKSSNKYEGLDIIINALNRYKKEIPEDQIAERNILKDLSQINNISTITFVMGDVAGQNIKNIRKIIPDVLPSRLSQIATAIDETNDFWRLLPIDHPWKDQNNKPMDGSLRLIRDVLGIPKYLKPLNKGKRAPYKAEYVDSLDILNAIFLKRDYNLKDIIAEFSSKLSYDVLGVTSYKVTSSIARSTERTIANQVYSIRTNISKMIFLLLFFEKVGVIKMERGKSYVSKYLERHEGLKPLNTFLSDESKGINTKEKEYAFLVGLLFGKLVSIQMAKKISSNAIKWLKGLQLSQQDLMEIFVKTRSKLDDYSIPKSAWSDEMKGVAEAIGAIGADIENWDISRKEIAFYLCVGQSLSGYYLPSKSKFESYDGSD